MNTNTIQKVTVVVLGLIAIVGFAYAFQFATSETVEDRADVNRDGVIDLTDVSIVMALINSPENVPEVIEEDVEEVEGDIIEEGGVSVSATVQ